MKTICLYEVQDEQYMESVKILALEDNFIAPNVRTSRWSPEMMSDCLMEKKTYSNMPKHEANKSVNIWQKTERIILRDTRYVSEGRNNTFSNVLPFKSVVRYIYTWVSECGVMLDEQFVSYSRFAITRVIVLESSYLFLTEGMYTSGYIT